MPDDGSFGRHPLLSVDRVHPRGDRAAVGATQYEVRIKYDGAEESIVYQYNPCDVEGWRGDYFPWKLNIRDWNVVMSNTLHLVPTVYAFLERRASGC